MTPPMRHGASRSDHRGRVEDVQATECDRLAHICQRIRAGWLPHRLSTGSWWWGRPAEPEGFRLWSDGFVPSMSVVEAMTPEEIETWSSTLHPMAPEASV